MTLSLLHLPERIVQQMLIDVGQAGNAELVPIPAWPVTVSLELDVPDSTLTVYGTNPQHMVRHQVTGEDVREEGIQIRIRARRYDVAGEKALALFNYITKTLYQRSVTVTGNAGSTTYHLQSMRVTSGPVPLFPRNRPASERAVFVINCLVTFTEF